MCYYLKENVLLYNTQLSPEPAQSTNSPCQDTDVRKKRRDNIENNYSDLPSSGKQSRFPIRMVNYLNYCFLSLKHGYRVAGL